MQSDEGSLSSKKRNRTSTVSIACVSCRSKHIKCDGKNPCDNCKKKGAECSYQKTPVKRGPTSGTIIWLKKVVSGLTEELSKQAEASQQWQAKYDNLIQNVNKKALPPGTLPSTHIVPMEQLEVFISHYMTRCFKYFRISPPRKGDNGQEDEMKIGCATAMAAYGAIAMGNEGIGFDFANKARVIVSGKFDNVTPVVAASYFILSSLYAYRFDTEREYFYNENALAMTDRLLKKTKVKMIDGIDLEHLYLIAHLASLCYKYSANPHPIMDFLRNLSQRQDLLDFCLMNMLHKMYGSVYQALAVNEANQIDLMYNKLATLDLLEVLVNSVGPEAEKFLLRIDTLRAFIHLVLSQDELAEYRADRALAKFDKLPAPENGIMLVMMPLYLLAQIFMYRNMSEQAQQTIDILSNNIRTYSSLSNALEILLDQSPDMQDVPRSAQQNTNAVFAMNFVYLRLETYRMNAARWASQMGASPSVHQQSLLPVKSELSAPSSNTKMPATPPYSTGPSDGISALSRTAPHAVSAQLKSHDTSSQYGRTNANLLPPPSSNINSSPNSGNNAPSPSQVARMQESLHGQYASQFSGDYGQGHVNTVPQSSAGPLVVSNTVPLAPHQQHRSAAPYSSVPQFDPQRVHAQYQHQGPRHVTGEQHGPSGVNPYGQHGAEAPHLSANMNMMAMAPNTSSNNRTGHVHVDQQISSEQYQQQQQYYHHHPQPDGQVFSHSHPHNPYSPHFHPHSFFSPGQHQQHHTSRPNTAHDMEQHPQSERFH